MAKIIWIIPLVFVLGCATIAEESPDGKTLKITGIGKAKFQSGAEIEGKPMIQFPSLPPVEVDQ